MWMLVSCNTRAMMESQTLHCLCHLLEGHRLLPEYNLPILYFYIILLGLLSHWEATSLASPSRLGWWILTSGGLRRVMSFICFWA